MTDTNKRVLRIFVLLLLTATAFFLFISALLTGTFTWFSAMSLTAGLFGMTATGLLLYKHYGYADKVRLDLKS